MFARCQVFVVFCCPERGSHGNWTNDCCCVCDTFHPDYPSRLDCGVSGIRRFCSTLWKYLLANIDDAGEQREKERERAHRRGDLSRLKRSDAIRKATEIDYFNIRRFNALINRVCFRGKGYENILSSIFFLLLC